MSLYSLSQLPEDDFDNIKNILLKLSGALSVFSLSSLAGGLFHFITPEESKRNWIKHIKENVMSLHDLHKLPEEDFENIKNILNNLSGALAVFSLSSLVSAKLHHWIKSDINSEDGKNNVKNWAEQIKNNVEILSSIENKSSGKTFDPNYLVSLNKGLLGFSARSAIANWLVADNANWARNVRDQVNALMGIETDVEKANQIAEMIRSLTAAFNDESLWDALKRTILPDENNLANTLPKIADALTTLKDAPDDIDKLANALIKLHEVSNRTFADTKDNFIEYVKQIGDTIPLLDAILHGKHYGDPDDFFGEKYDATNYSPGLLKLNKQLGIEIDKANELIDKKDEINQLIESDKALKKLTVMTLVNDMDEQSKENERALIASSQNVVNSGNTSNQTVNVQQFARTNYYNSWIKPQRHTSIFGEGAGMG